MVMIGFATGAQEVYERSTGDGYALFPPPLFTAADVTAAEDRERAPAIAFDLMSAQLIFREDSFEPTSRVRRGRFYARVGSAHKPWLVLRHPMHRPVVSPGLQQELLTYEAHRIGPELRRNAESQSLVRLGFCEDFTTWIVISVERISTGEDLVTLRARPSFGVLPELRVQAIPDEERPKVTETVKKVAEDVYRSGPESVIDRCRDACASILAGYLRSVGEKTRGKELGDLIEQLRKLTGERERRIVVRAAGIVGLLHSRAKPSVQEKHPSRPIREQDGELAVQCLGVVLCDLGWADWQ